MKKSFLSACFVILASVMLSSCSNDEDGIRLPSEDAQAVSSSRISIDEARADLESLLDDLERNDSRGLGTYSHRRIKSSYAVTLSSPASRSEDADSSVIYVFNFEDEEGYAIMSGDERLPSLISLTESGSLEEGEEIDDPGVAIFLEGVERHLEDQKMNITQNVISDVTFGGADYDIYGEWENIVYNQYGVCPVKWGQDSIYNEYCPKINNQHTATGCAATALAQLMAIYKYPQSYRGYTFSWEDMLYYPMIDLCPAKGRNDIARLMQQLGLKDNLDISYGIKGSSAQDVTIIRTLRSFGYTTTMDLKDYKTSDVIEDLKNGYGVLIGGQSHKKVTKIFGITVNVEYDGGHLWLAHGLLERRRKVSHYSASGSYTGSSYETQWYPLCNWGWNGLSDGYYLSGAFDSTKGGTFSDYEPSSRNDETVIEEGTDGNYQYKLFAVTGIRK